MSDKIIKVSYQGISREFCINPLFPQDVDFKPVAMAFKEVKVKMTRHTVKDGRKNFPWYLASFFLRLIGFFVMLVLSILLLIVGSWFTSGQVVEEFLGPSKDLHTIVLNSKLAYAAGALCFIISLYLLGSATVLGNLMFSKRDLSQLKDDKKMSNGSNKLTPIPKMASALKSNAQK